MKAIAYMRCSTDGQAEDGYSLEVQREKIGAYARLYGLDLVAVISDPGESGKSLDRPGLQRALQELRAGNAQALLVAKLDRLTRSVRDLDVLLSGVFVAGGAHLLSVSEQIDTRTAAGRLVLNILASVSQWEREIISERTTQALALKRSRGERVGQIQYGAQLSEDGKTLSPHPTESLVVEQILEWREDGLSSERITRRLTDAGIEPRGARWHTTSVDRIIRRYGDKAQRGQNGAYGPPRRQDVGETVWG